MQKRRHFLRGAALGAAYLALGEDAKAAEAGEAMEAAAKVRHLGQPCRARNVHIGTTVQDAGREWFVITNTNENANVELIFIDAKGDTGHVYRAPAGAGAWALHKLPGNRIAIATYYDGTFMVFDVTKREWVRTIKFPGEDYVWTLAQGKDGRLYGGSYPGGKLGAFDADKGTVEDLGAPTKADGNLYLRWTSALPDGRIFCQFGFTKPETMIFDPDTKQFARAPEHMQSLSSGVVWNGYFLAGDKAYRSPDLSVADPLPFPAPPADKGAWAIDVRLTDEKTLVLRQGTDVYQYGVGDAALTKVLYLRARGSGALMARGEAGDYYGIRGQDYFAMRKGDAKQNLRIIPGEAAARGTHFLTIDDSGTLWGGPTFGQTLFYQDTKTGKYTNTGVVSDYGGEVYDVEVIDGVCYAVAYAGGELIRFDPRAKWDQVSHVNPKTIVRVGGSYIRPSAGVTTGPDGRLYSGWLAQYGQYGGLLLVADPKTGKNEQHKNPLGPHGLSAVAPVGGDLVVIGTTIYGNGLGNQKDTPAKLGVFDLKAKKTVWQRDFPGVASIGGMVYDPKSRRVAFLASGLLHLFDPAAREIVGGKPALAEKVTSHGLAAHGGEIFYAVEKRVFALDAATGKARTVADVPGKVDSLAVGGPAGRVYVACGIDVYEIAEA